MREELVNRRRPRRCRPFKSVAELEEFFRRCDALEGTGVEPDWDKHLGVIAEARRRRASGT